MNLPNFIDNEEKIVRVLFHPHNFNNSGKIRSNVYRSPSGKDEVSVIRLDYCTANFCKSRGKKIQRPEEKKAYFGLAVLIADEIRSLNAEVVHTPEKENIYHADIKIGFVPQKNEELPSQFKFIVDELVRLARYYKDPNPEIDEWHGEDLI
jgi:hypothetical protein